MEDLDYLYYRNRVALRNTKGLPYKTLRSYTTCDESQMKKAQQTSRNEFSNKPGKPGDVVASNPNMETQKIVGI